MGKAQFSECKVLWRDDEPPQTAKKIKKRHRSCYYILGRFPCDFKAATGYLVF